MTEDLRAPAPMLNSFIPIAELQPSCSSTAAIKSVVALLWPYSASNKSITLLLVEPDFRLRRNKGQVRVEFHGSSAKEVARSGICSGDEVVLSLESAGWKKDEAGVRTPGNGVDWKLSFGERVSMQIRRDSHQLANLNVDYPNLSPEPTPTSVTPPRSPTSRTAEPSSAFRFMANSEPNVWRSPAFLKRARTSSGLFDDLYDVFAEERVDKPAKRSKVGRISGQWRYAETLPDPQDGADSGLPDHPMSEVVDIEAGLELATEGESADSPSGPGGDLNEARTNELANSAARAHYAKSEGTHSTEAEEGGTLVEDESLPTPYMPPRGVIVETTDLREDVTIDIIQDLSFVESSLSSSNPPIYEAQSRRIYAEEHSPLEGPEGSALHLTSTAMQTVDTETAFPGLHEDVWEAPVLPDSPLLRPTASPGLPLVSPIMGRAIMDYSVHEEHQDENFELKPDTEDGRFESQSTPDPVSEVSDQDDHAVRQSTEGDHDLEQSNISHVSPSRFEQRQVVEGRSLNLDGSITSHQKGRDQSDGSIMPTDFVQETLKIPNVYARSPLQDVRSEPPSSVGSVSESALRGDDESNMEDFEDFPASDDVFSEGPTDGTESLAEHEPLGRASSEEEQSWEAESDDEERNLFAQHQSYDGKDANNKNIEPVSTQGPEIIDLEDDSEDESQPDAASSEVQTLEEVVSSPVAVSSPSDDGSSPSDFNLSSTNAESISEDEASEHITCPALPTEESEQPPTSYLLLPPESQNAEAGLDQQRRTQLFTPNATQPSHKERSVSVELLDHDHDLPTPQLTQTTSAGLLSLEVINLVEDRAPPRNELRSLTVPLPRGMSDRMSSVPDAISPWFALKRNSQVYEASEEDDESDSQSEQSLDSEPQNLSRPVVERKIEIKLPHFPTELETATTISNGNTTVQSPHPFPPPVGLRTPLSYFSPLATLQDHFASTIDVLAILTSTAPLQRSKSGPKDYHLTLTITDPSSNSSYTSVQIFRPFKEALPVASKGAAILLRNFKVQSQKHRFMLVSTSSSAWAVFEKGQSVQVNGPPVEIGAEERGFAKGLSQWWASPGQDAQRANGDDQRLGKHSDDHENGNISIRRTKHASNGLT